MHKLYDARETYLKDALDITDTEQALIPDFSDWLPADVIDESRKVQGMFHPKQHNTPKMIVESTDDVLRLTRDFPDFAVAIAHLGSADRLYRPCQ
ncbi:MAG: hypothetical protein JWM37_737 [Candidatus Saccharibacteria bacterium]|nr:hypothetical protein [Candidatus Saccharibacteria bacterium]